MNLGYISYRFFLAINFLRVHYLSMCLALYWRKGEINGHTHKHARERAQECKSNIVLITRAAAVQCSPRRKTIYSVGSLDN